MEILEIDPCHLHCQLFPNKKSFTLHFHNTKAYAKTKAIAREQKREKARHKKSTMMTWVTTGSGHKQTTPEIPSFDQNESPSRPESYVSKVSGSGHKQTIPKSPSLIQKDPPRGSESCHNQLAPKSPSLDQNEPQSGPTIYELKGSGLGQAHRAEFSGRERLKRHRAEMTGQVWIPDVWGQEGLLKDWAEKCTSFDAMRNSSLVSARAALVQEGRMRANSTGLKLEKSW